MTTHGLDGFAFNHNDYEMEYAGVRYFTAKSTTVLAGGGTPSQFRKICHITLHRGAVYVQFTYFGDVAGMVAVLSAAKQSDGTWKMDLGTHGIVAPTLVKYSHPPDGCAHFSQDGKVLSAIRRQSFPLTSGQGHLFELHAFLPTTFEPFQPGDERSNRLYAPFYFPHGVPDAIVVVGMWWPFERLAALKPTDRQLGPLETMVNLRTSANFKAFYLVPPTVNPPTHVLLLNVGPAVLPESISAPQLIFLGGWDDHAEANSDPGECLAFMYPLEDQSKWERLRGSIAYPDNLSEPSS